MKQFARFPAADRNNIVEAVAIAHKQLIQLLVLRFDQLVILHKRLGDVIDYCGFRREMKKQGSATEKGLDISIIRWYQRLYLSDLSGLPAGPFDNRSHRSTSSQV